MTFSPTSASLMAVVTVLNAPYTGSRGLAAIVLEGSVLLPSVCPAPQPVTSQDHQLSFLQRVYGTAYYVLLLLMCLVMEVRQHCEWQFPIFEDRLP